MIAMEAEAMLAELANELRILNLPGLDHVDVVLDRDNWLLGGTAVLLRDGATRLTLTLGFFLAVEEAVLEFLSNDDALCPIVALTEARADDDLHPAAVHSLTFKTARRRGRYRDYRAAQARSAPERLTGGFPIDLWRLRQHDLLFTLVVRWAALPEIAHGALRHNEVLAELYGAEAGRTGMVETEPACVAEGSFAWQRFGYDAPPDLVFDMQPVRKVLELHADTAALWMSLDLARLEADRGDGLFAAYERDMSALVGDNPNIFGALAPDTRTHLILLAALIAIVLFEQARRATGMEEGNSHPIPEARLITLLRSGFYGCQWARADGQGGFEIETPATDLFGDGPTSPWNRFMQDAIARAVEDMTFFANVLDLDIQLFDPANGPPPELAIEYAPDGYPRPIRDLDQSDTAAWWRDVLLRSRTSLAARGGPTITEMPASAGGRELATLDPYQPHLNFLTEVFQHLHGAPLTFLLTVRASGSA